MPGETALSNIRKSDFFAVLGSGAYVVSSLGLLVVEIFNRNAGPYSALRGLSHTVKDNWPVAVALLFLAFLIGNALRALKVNAADDLWKKLWFDESDGLRKHFRDLTNHERNLIKDSFPYPAMLLAELKLLKRGIRQDERLVLEPYLIDLGFTFTEDKSESTENKLATEIWHAAYNFWKAELCRENLSAFEYTQDLEGRVRLFANMHWASLAGAITGVVGILIVLG